MNILSLISGRAMAIDADSLRAYMAMPRVAEVTEAAVEAGALNDRRVVDIGDCFDPSDPCSCQRIGDGAVIHFSGMLYHGQSWIMNMMGGLSYQLASARCEQLASDTSVKWVVVAVNSGGGTVMGVTDLAAAMSALAKSKPTVVVANGVLASSAYWISAGATEIVATPTAIVGSIAVRLVVDDTSAMYEKAGISRRVVVSDGDTLKAEGTDGVKVSEEAIKQAELMIAEPAELFRSAVASGRKMSVETVKSFRGGVFTAGASLANKLVDRVESLVDCIARVQSTYGGTGAAAVKVNPEPITEDAPVNPDDAPESRKASMDIKTLTAEELKKGRPDLIEAIVKDAKPVAEAPKPATRTELGAIFGNDAAAILASLDANHTPEQATKARLDAVVAENANLTAKLAEAAAKPAAPAAARGVDPATIVRVVGGSASEPANGPKTMAEAVALLTAEYMAKDNLSEVKAKTLAYTEFPRRFPDLHKARSASLNSASAPR